VGCHWLGRVLIFQDRRAEGVEKLRKSLSLSEGLYGEDPTNEVYVDGFLLALRTCAEFVEQPEEARQLMERRFVVLEKAAPRMLSSGPPWGWGSCKTYDSGMAVASWKLQSRLPCGWLMSTRNGPGS